MNETTPLVVRTGDADGGGGGPAPSSSPLSSPKPPPSAAPPRVRDLAARASTSMRRIGVLGSVSIAANSLTGPAMLCLPATYQRSGLIPTTVVIVCVCVLSALCCLHTASAISKVPHNRNFAANIGYSECFRHFWGERSCHVTQVLFFCCVTCLNVSSIVDTAQVVDTFFAHWVSSGAAALHFEWTNDNVSVRWMRWDYDDCSEPMLSSGECVPFFDEDGGGVLLTAGYVVTALVFLPMAVMDLKENAFAQVIGFGVLLATSLGFVGLFVSRGIDATNLSLWGTEWGSLFGVVLFNFALVIAVPAWLYEKESYVDVAAVVHSSSLLTTILYMSIGILGAITMPHASQNMLQSLMSGAFGTAIQLCSSIFAFFIIGLGIPLFGILARMNLTEDGDGDGGGVSRGAATWLAIHCPFLCSWLFYRGDAIEDLLSWGGILFTSLIAFVLPLLLSLRSIETTKEEGSVNVYEPFRVTSRGSQKLAIRIVLLFAVASVVVAIWGNFRYHFT